MSEQIQNRCCKKNHKFGKFDQGFYPKVHQDMLPSKQNHLKRLLNKKCMLMHYCYKLHRKNRNPDMFYQRFFQTFLLGMDLRKLIRLKNKDCRMSDKLWRFPNRLNNFHHKVGMFDQQFSPIFQKGMD